MKYFIVMIQLAYVYGQTHVCLPNNHSLKTVADRAFFRADHNSDGGISLIEFEETMQRGDTNHDTKVSKDEYLNGTNSNEIDEAMFHHFDTDKDNFLEIYDMVQEFHEIDHDRNGLVNIHELEHYLTTVLYSIYGHAHCSGSVVG